MPRTKSALKAKRASERRRIMNAKQQNNLDRLLRAMKKAGKATGEELSQAQKALDKAVKNGLFHARRAARLKGQLAKLTSRPAETLTKPIKAKKRAK